MPGGGGLSGQNIAGLLSNFVSTGATKSGLSMFSVSLAGVANVVLRDGGLSMAVNASMLTDQLGFSYAQQFAALIGVAPIADVIFAQIQLSDPSAMNSFQNAMNSLFGANDPETEASQPELPGPL